MNKVFAALGALISAIYIINPGAGIIELIPDNIPFIGNLDEAAATLLLVQCLKALFSKQEGKVIDIPKDPEV